jgi:hypothetical protein
MSFGVVALVACGPNKEPAMPSAGPSTGEALGGVQCTAVRPQTEPDLMAWDSGSRATLRSVKEQGVVVVRYEAEGCNVQLHVLPNCAAKGSYAFSPYSATETKLARTANELFAELPIGAAKLSGKLKGTRAIRTDYMMAGVESLKIGATFKREELVGDCNAATHVVTKIYVGGFALAAGESRDLEGGASVFVVPGVGVGGGAKSESAVQRLQNEGSAKACEEAQEKGTPSPQCSVPLRIALMPLGAQPVACPGESTWDGRQCVGQVPAPTTAPAARSPAVAASSSAGPRELLQRGKERLREASLGFKDPAAGGTSRPFDRGAAAGALKDPKLASCPSWGDTTAHATITFDPAGHVSSVCLDDADPSVGACLERNLLQLRVPPFAGPPVNIGTGFNLSPPPKGAAAPVPAPFKQCPKRY